ncbi:MAG TPA: biotin/lipoate A/B protein ligase family protein [Candidatus Nitrosotalea sp.]|nr:biotin/lipoate A/B protein ligase family protein [Candidatus Nitrosotalea sp.]
MKERKKKNEREAMSFKFSKIRTLETGYNSGPWNMALDEVLMNCINYHTMPILRIYGWRPPTVSIGYFQSMDEEVDIKRCRQMGIDVVRRITGGGAVLHELELTYSFITNVYPKNIMESYNLICDPIVICINKLGFNAKFAPLNDIIVDGKKVSGNAQTRKKGTLLQHGTILLSVNLEKMFSVLNVPSEKVKDKMIDDAKERVMGLNKPFDEVAYNLKESFSDKFGAEIVVDNLTTKEEESTKKLTEEKYTSDKWNLKR